MTEKISIQKSDPRKVNISFRNHGNLSLLKHDYISYTLKELITHRGTSMMIDLTGVKFIDHEGFDVLNLLSRLARKYDSQVALKGVEPGLMEMMSLLKKYSVFDIKHIEPAESQIA